MARPPANDLLRGSMDLLVLSVLADEPLYGYAIIKRVGTRSDETVRLTPGVLYPLLHQMEKQGLLTAVWDEVQAAGSEEGSRGRRRKWYRLSAKGRKRLTHRAAAHRAVQRILEGFLPDPEGEGA